MSVLQLEGTVHKNIIVKATFPYCCPDFPFSGPFEYHWVSNLGSLGSSKEIQPYIPKFPVSSVKNVELSRSITLGFLITNTCMCILSDMKCALMIWRS